MNSWAPGRTVDVVCRMLIHPEDAATTEEFEGHTFYFCSMACHETFTEDRALYARLAEPVPTAKGRAVRRRHGHGPD